MGGARYSLNPAPDLTAAYYGYHQNAYGTGIQAGCTSIAAHSTCSGSFEAFSFDADYRNRHFDAYVGAMYSGVHDGVAAATSRRRISIPRWVRIQVLSRDDRPLEAAARWEY